MSRWNVSDVMTLGAVAVRTDTPFHEVLDGTMSTVDVEVTDGVVTLAGELASRSAVVMPARLVEGLDGVIRVDNRLGYRHDDSSFLSGEAYSTADCSGDVVDRPLQVSPSSGRTAVGDAVA